MVVRGRGTPAGRDETPHSTGSLLAPPSRPERTRHPGTVVAFRIPRRRVWARGGRSGGADRTAGGSGGPNARTRAGLRRAPWPAQPNPKVTDRIWHRNWRDVGIAGSPFHALHWLHVDTAKAVEHTEQFSINLTKPAVPPARGPPIHLIRGVAHDRP